MQKYKYLIFDFDGTVNDTSEGIFQTFKEVLNVMGVDYSDVDFSRYIGPPLQFSYTQLMGAERCEECVALHRQVYAKNNALAKSRLYEGMLQTLRRLKEAGYVLAVASCKYQPHAMQSIQMHGLAGIFDSVYGQQENRCYKNEILCQLIADNGWEREKCLMIGDTVYDIDGAHENGIDAMGVTYGFGKIEQLQSAGAEYIARSPNQIAEILLGMHD